MSDLEEKKKKDEVVSHLKRVTYPGLSRDIVSFGFVKSVNLNGNNVNIDIEVSTKEDHVLEDIEQNVRKALSSIGWIGEIYLSVRKKGSPFHKKKPPIKGKFVAIYSTKGGVGKSAVAVNLSFALKNLGLKTSLLDLDVYGPSIPLMTGTQGYKPHSPDGIRIIPNEKNGIKIMSLGYLVESDTPVIWRGPMVAKAFDTLVFDTLWPETEILIADMPPGTGDVQLSLAQKALIDGIVIVTTPQEASLLDVRRGIKMFEKLDVKIVGIVENMSYFICPNCGVKHYIFGEGGGSRVSKDYKIPFLGELPIDPRIREFGDIGKSIIEIDPQCNTSLAFFDLAKKIAQEFSLIQ